MADVDKRTKVLLVAGVIFFLVAWVMEIYFHFISDFTEETVGSDIFWRAEIPIAIGSSTLLFGGLILFIIGLYYWRKKKR